FPALLGPAEPCRALLGYPRPAVPLRLFPGRPRLSAAPVQREPITRQGRFPGHQGGGSVPALPQPEILCCYFDNGFSPRLAAMRLHWPVPGEADGPCWDLPGGVRLTGPPPESFGVRIQRWGDDSYAACLLWDPMRLQRSARPR